MLNSKLLGRSGLRVSELCLGTMSFGLEWDFGADEATSRAILDAYRDAGGNFLDTADKYHGGQTEEYLGRWLKGDRDRMVLATEYTLARNHADPSLLQRDGERDLLPMAEHHDLGVTAWAPLAGGVLTGKYTRGSDPDTRRAARNEGRLSEAGLAVARAVDELADRHGASSTQVALAWVLSRGYRYIPIVGARKLEQIENSLGATALRLAPEDLAHLNELTRIELGFPHDFLASAHVQEFVHGEVGVQRLQRPPRA